MIPRAPAGPPDVLALPLAEARARLEAAGYVVEVSETRPPGRRVPQGALRVVRQLHEGGRVVLLVTHERYERPAPAPAPVP